MEKLTYKDLEWSSDEYARLGKALRLCDALEEVELRWENGLGRFTEHEGVWSSAEDVEEQRKEEERMRLEDAGAAAMLAGPPVPSIKKFTLEMPDGSNCFVERRLRVLNECGLPRLTIFPSLDSLPSLEYLTLQYCISLTTLGSLNALASLKKLDLCGCASLTTLPLLDALVSLEE